MTAGNVLLSTGGRRRCRECSLAAQRDRYAASVKLKCWECEQVSSEHNLRRHVRGHGLDLSIAEVRARADEIATRDV